MINKKLQSSKATAIATKLQKEKNSTFFQNFLVFCRNSGTDVVDAPAILFGTKMEIFCLEQQPGYFGW